MAPPGGHVLRLWANWRRGVQKRKQQQQKLCHPNPRPFLPWTMMHPGPGPTSRHPRDVTSPARPFRNNFEAASKLGPSASACSKADGATQGRCYASRAPGLRPGAPARRAGPGRVGVRTAHGSAIGTELPGPSAPGTQYGRRRRTPAARPQPPPPSATPQPAVVAQPQPPPRRCRPCRGRRRSGRGGGGRRPRQGRKRQTMVKAALHCFPGKSGWGGSTEGGGEAAAATEEGGS